MRKAHLWKIQFTGLTDIKRLTRKLSSWSWHQFIRVALARFLWSNRMWERPKRWNRSNWCRITISLISALRADSSEEVQLRRCRIDPWSEHVPLYQPIGVFWNRPKEYSNSRPFTVGLGIEWSTTFDFGSVLDMLQGCYSKRNRLISRPIRKWYDSESDRAYKQVDPRSAANARAEKILQETTYHDGSRYHVSMLWVDDQNSLLNNYFSALVQLKSLERRLGNDPKLKEEYFTTIRDNFSNGYIVKVEKSNCFKTDQPRERYLPHHPVFHPHKPGKVRQCLNGAAKIHGLLLNNALINGPMLLQKLIHLLLRFRKHPYVVSAHIEGMLLQVGVNPKDQPSLCSLWQEDPATEVAVFQKARHISDMFHVIWPLEYFETDQKGTLIALRLPLGWVLSGLLPSTSRLVWTRYTDWERLLFGRSNAKLVRHGIVWCLQTTWSPFCLQC